MIDYLYLLEQQRGLYFSFIDRDIAGLQIEPAPDKPSKAALIAYLQASSGLVFTLVSDNYVVIHRKETRKDKFCGVVHDADTRQPIAGASIRAANGERSVSDKRGYFAIAVAAGTPISVSHLGYKKKSVVAATAAETDCPQLLLQKQVTELEQVAVQHFMTNGLQINADRSYEMHPRQTALLPGLTEPDVLQTLQQLPGIVSIDQSVSNISVRAGSHDQNLFLWNGIRLFQTGHFFGLISAFNPNLPHAVTIYKNGTPALYGESVSGTILIDSKPDQGAQQTSVGLNMINADFNSSFRTGEKTAWQFSGRRSLTDLFRSPVYKGYRERVFQHTKVTNFFADQSLDYTSEENFSFYDLTAQVQHQIDARSSIRANAILIANNLEVTQQSSVDLAAETSELKQTSLASNLQYERQWSTTQRSDVQIAVSNYKLYSQDFYEDNDQVIEQENNVLDKMLAVNHRMLLPQDWTLRMQYAWSDLAVANDSYRANTRTQQTLALQLNGGYGDFYLATGLRALHLLTYKRFRVEPRLAVSYRWAPPWTLTVAAEAKSQTAYQEIERQQDFFGIETRRWKLADDRSTPMLTSNQASLELQYQAYGWLLTGEAFVKKVHDIASGSQGFQNQFASSAVIGDYTVKGVELLAQKRLGDFTAWLNFHVNDSKYYFQTLHPQVFTNSYETPQAFRWGLIYASKRWEAAAGGIWSAGRYYTPPNSRIPSIADDGSLFVNYAQPNSSQLDDNLQLNASCSLLLLAGKRVRFKTGVAVQNILDDTSVINRTYRINRINQTIEEIDNYNLARTTNVFIRAYF